MKTHFVLLCLLLAGICKTHSQILTVRDINTGNPVPMVTLMSSFPKAFATTNREGQTDISNFKTADNIEIRLLGYESEIISYSEIENLNFIVNLIATNINLEQIVISATRWKQSSNNIPSKIISVDAKQIAFQNPQTAADLLNISGNVYIQKSQQGGGSPMIRGFSTNRLLYTVDGVRMNTAIFRGGNLQNVINIDPFATENVEVLFGPGSIIYGSDAIGGVMSFQTLTPELSLHDEILVGGEAVTRYSSANQEKTAHFDVNVGWKKWAFVTSMSSWDFDHLKQGSHGPSDYIKSIYVERQDGVDRIISQQDPLLQIPSAYSQINLMQKIRFKPNENWDVQFGFHYSETSPYGRYDRNTRYRNGTLRYAEWNYGPQKWMMNNLSFNHSAKNYFYDEVTLRLAQQSFEESRMDRALNKDARRINSENVQAYSVNLDFKKSIKERHTLFYGMEYVKNDVKSAGTTTNIITEESSAGASRYPNATWNSIAAYANDEFKVSDKLAVVGGLRYNHISINADFASNLDFYPFPFSEAQLDNGSLTGSIGAVYRPNASWVLSSNFATAFRAPNVDDLGKVFDSEAGAVTVPNPDLKAEYAYNYDIGIAKVFNKKIKLDATAFFTILDKALVRRDYRLAGRDSIMYDGQLSKVQAIQNAAFAKIYGVQVGVEIKLPAGFSFSTDLNYQHGDEELDDGSTGPSRHAPPFFGFSRLNFKHDKLQLELYTNFMAQRKFEDLPFEEKTKDESYAKDANGNNYAPRWQTLNFKASYTISKSFTIYSGIENLMDKRYRPYSSGISASGRNYSISLRVDI